MGMMGQYNAECPIDNREEPRHGVSPLRVVTRISEPFLRLLALSDGRMIPRRPRRLWGFAALCFAIGLGLADGGEPEAPKPCSLQVQELRGTAQLLRDQLHELRQTLGRLLPRPTPEAPRLREIERRGNLSFAEFQRHYSGRAPVIFTDLQAIVPPWGAAYFAEVCAEKGVPAAAYRAGALRFGEGPYVPVRDFVAQYSTARAPGYASGAAGQYYMFDWSLPKHCPEALANFTVPKYFAHDLLQRLGDADIRWVDSWPSLFIGPQGTRSPVHVDVLDTHFWMMQLRGRKEWVVYPRDARPLLYEDRPAAGFAVPDLFDADPAAYPLMSLAQGWRGVVYPGEVIYIPHGSPHQVGLLFLTRGKSTPQPPSGGVPQANATQVILRGGGGGAFSGPTHMGRSSCFNIVMARWVFWEVPSCVSQTPPPFCLFMACGLGNSLVPLPSFCVVKIPRANQTWE